MAKPTEESSGSPALGNWLQLGLAGIWRYRPVVVLGGLLGVGLGVFQGLVTPNQFRSVGKLYVRPGVRDAMSPDWAFGGGGSRMVGARDALMTELQILTVPQLYEKAALRIGLDNLLVPYDPAAEDDETTPLHTRLFHQFQSWWFAPRTAKFDAEVDRLNLACLLLEDSVRILPELGANVIAVSYTSHAPEMAQAVVNSVLEAAQIVHRDVLNSLSSVRALEEEVAEAEEAARKAEQRLREFRLEHGIYDYDTQRKELLDYIASIDRQVDLVDSEQRLKVAERKVLEGLKSDVPMERLVAGSESSILNPTYASLLQLLVELQRMEFELDLTDHAKPDYQRRKELMSSQRQNINAQLGQEGLRLDLGGLREENPQYQRLVTNIEDVDVAIGGLQARREQLVELKTAKQELLKKIEAQAPRLRTLELEARQRRSAADRLSDGVANMQMVQRLEQHNLSSIGIMQMGTYDPVKVAPRRGRYVALGAIGGLLAGACIAFLLTWREPRIRNRYDVIRHGIPADSLYTRAGATVLGLPDAEQDIDRFWLQVPYDRRATESLRLACLPVDSEGNTGYAAAVLALGLAIHGGERVVVVGCREQGDWLAEALDLPRGVGWSEVLRENFPLATAVQATSVPNLSYLPLGTPSSSALHPLAGRSFLLMLDQLVADYRFVVVDLPSMAQRPEVSSVLGVVDAAFVVLRLGTSQHSDLASALAAVRSSGATFLGSFVHPTGNQRGDMRAAAQNASPHYS